jgi:hypothetical protein
MKWLVADLLRGTLIATSVGVGCFLLARFAFGKLYYLGILLSAALVTLLLVAWLIHLKVDGFFGRSRKEAVPEPKRDPELPFATLDDGILPRGGSHPQDVRPWGSLDVMRALLWAAGELALLSIALYHFVGIGAAF